MRGNVHRLINICESRSDGSYGIVTYQVSYPSRVYR